MGFVILSFDVLEIDVFHWILQNEFVVPAFIAFEIDVTDTQFNGLHWFTRVYSNIWYILIG